MPRGGTGGYRGGLGVKKNFSPKFNRIWCVSYLNEWHMYRHNVWVPTLWGLGEGSKILFSEHGHVAYQIKGEEQETRIHWKILTYDQVGDLGMGSKGQLPLDFFESVGICDGAPSNVF